LETTTFAELGLSAKLLAAITAAGYTTPTPIQAQAIPVAVTGRDILGIAQTGTGKTAAFVMPMITRLETGRARARMPRSLILAPTRELAAQVEQSFIKYGTNHKLDVALLIGGVSMDEQVRKLDRGVDVLIATPGRMLDHFQRGRLMLMGVEILVIDEADRMLDMGFIPDIEKICKLLPPKRQTLFFSATMPPEITRLVNTFLTDPLRVEVARPATTAATITQRFVYCRDGEDYAKREALRELIKGETVKNAIIFCNRKRDVAIVHKSLVKHGFNAGALHGDMDQSSRTATLDKFRSGEVLFLVASDVAARGLDIPDVSHVFNYDVPWQADDYVHRIGRTGRAGKLGFSASLVGAEDFKAVAEIEKITGQPAVWVGEIPSAEDIADGAKRKRGRGRPGSSASSPARPGSSRPGSSRAEGSGRSRGGDRERSPRPPSAEDGAPAESRGEREPRAERPRLGRRPRGGDRPAAVAAPHQGQQEGQHHDQHLDQQQQPDVHASAPDASAREARPPRRGEQRGPRPERQRDRQQDRARHDRPREDRAPKSQVSDDRGRGEQPSQAARPERSHDRGPPNERPVRVRDGRPPQRDGQRDGQRGDGPNVGFAENVPAFLKRPVKGR
jgi:superfamily II DNA/RNA helicase